MIGWGVGIVAYSMGLMTAFMASGVDSPVWVNVLLGIGVGVGCHLIDKGIKGAVKR